MNKIKEIDKLRQEWTKRSMLSIKHNMLKTASMEANVAFGLFLALEVLNDIPDTDVELNCCAIYSKETNFKFCPQCSKELHR